MDWENSLEGPFYLFGVTNNNCSTVQADVNGLKWVRYVGPNSVNLEAPKDDPVLNSYAKLLNEG